MSRKLLTLFIVATLASQVKLDTTDDIFKEKDWNATKFIAQINQNITVLITDYEHLRVGPSSQAANAFMAKLDKTRENLKTLILKYSITQLGVAFLDIFGDQHFKEHVQSLEVYVKTKTFNKTMDWLAQTVNEYITKGVRFPTKVYDMTGYNQRMQKLQQKYSTYLDKDKFAAKINEMDGLVKKAVGQGKNRAKMGNAMREMFLDTMPLSSQLMVAGGFEESFAKARGEYFDIKARVANDFQGQFFLQFSAEVMRYYNMANGALSTSQASVLSILAMFLLTFFNHFRY